MSWLDYQTQIPCDLGTQLHFKWGTRPIAQTTVQNFTEAQMINSTLPSVIPVCLFSLSVTSTTLALVSLFDGPFLVFVHEASTSFNKYSHAGYIFKPCSQLVITFIH